MERERSAVCVLLHALNKNVDCTYFAYFSLLWSAFMWTSTASFMQESYNIKHQRNYCYLDQYFDSIIRDLQVNKAQVYNGNSQASINSNLKPTVQGPEILLIQAVYSVSLCNEGHALNHDNMYTWLLIIQLVESMLIIQVSFTFYIR